LETPGVALHTMRPMESGMRLPEVFFYAPSLMGLPACVWSSPISRGHSSAVLTGTSRGTIERTTDLYSTKSGQPLHLDRYSASNTQNRGKRPVLICSTGGGWEVADRADRAAVDFLEHFAELGYVAVSIDYRLGVKQA